MRTRLVVAGLLVVIVAPSCGADDARQRYCEERGFETWFVASGLEGEATGKDSPEEIWGIEAVSKMQELWDEVGESGNVEANVRWARIARAANPAAYERGCSFMYDLFGLLSHQERLWCDAHGLEVGAAGEDLGVEVQSPTSIGYPGATAPEHFEGYATACKAAYEFRTLPPQAGQYQGRIAFTSGRNSTGEVHYTEIFVMNADGSDQTGLACRIEGVPNPACRGPAWSPDGTRIAFQLYVDPWDPQAGSTTTSGALPRFDIYTMDADGANLTPLTSDALDRSNPDWASDDSEDRNPVWSPDGSRIAFDSNRDGDWDIHVVDADGSGLVNLTQSPGWDGQPAWSPDGNKIMFVSDREGIPALYVMNADGSNQAPVTDEPFEGSSPVWSPDGSRIAFHAGQDSATDIYVMDADGSNRIRLTDHSAFDGFPAWSPDGLYIAFQSGRDDRPEIYVMDADGGNLARLTDSPGRDGDPAWGITP